MAERPDEPMSSEEMLRQFRAEIERDAPLSADDLIGSEPVAPEFDTPETWPETSLSPQPRRRARRRPEKPPPDPFAPVAQRRAVIAGSVAVFLVILGFVAALVFAAAGT